MISSYTFSLAKPVGFLFCFFISGSGKPHSSKAVTAWSSHGAQESSFCHQVPSTRAGCGRKEPVVPWHSGCEPHGSPLEKGHEILWVSSFQFQQGLDNPKGRTEQGQASMQCPNLHSKFLWHELPRRLPRAELALWAPLRAGDGYVQSQNHTGKMRRLPTGCRNKA